MTRAFLSLLSVSVFLVSGAARAQYDDPYAPMAPDEQGGYYEPPAENAPPAGVVQVGAYGYGGIHPIPHDVGQGFCATQAAHSHPYQPFDTNLFHQQNGYSYFVGDPFDFGYSQSLYWYRGNHPVAVEAGGGYCYMSWPHRHHYAPARQLQNYFRMIGGHYVYQGPWDQPYYQYRERNVRYLNNYYRSYYYGNRYYRSRPRHVWRHGFGVNVNGGGVQVGAYGYAPQPPQPMPRPRVYGVPEVRPLPMPQAPYRPLYAPPPAPAYGRPAGGFVPPPPPAGRY